MVYIIMVQWENGEIENLDETNDDNEIDELIQWYKSACKKTKIKMWDREKIIRVDHTSLIA
jgi:hypothetical protein